MTETPVGPTNPFVRRLAIAAIAATIALIVGMELLAALQFASRPSGTADGYSEANAIRAAEGYVDRGFLAHHGLPDINYGEQFPWIGSKTDRGLCPSTNECVYLHYPPGPDLMTGVLTRVFGKGKIFLYRLFPLSVGLAALIVFVRALIARLGHARAALVFLACANAPLTYNMMHGLHYQGYALSLLLVQIALLVSAFSRSLGPDRRTFFALSLLSFVQGWLSFDYVFIVALAPIPIALSCAPRGTRPLRAAMSLVLVAGASFAAAHALHFAMVASELGGFHAMIAHFEQVAAARVESGPIHVELPWPTRLGVIIHYTLGLVPQANFVGVPFVPLVVGSLVLLARTVPLRLVVGSTVVRLDPGPNRVAATLAALGVSAAWIALMKVHAINHGHFLPRHFFLAYFVVILGIVESFELDLGSGETAIRVERLRRNEPFSTPTNTPDSPAENTP